MQISLYSILSHESFDWTCRVNKSALMKNLVVVVSLLCNISKVDSSLSSPLSKAATKIYDIAKKPKNLRKGLESFLEKEADVLKKHIVEIEEQFKESANEDEKEEKKGERNKEKTFQ